MSTSWIPWCIVEILSFIKDVRAILNSKELKNRVFESRKDGLGEGLVSRGRIGKKNNDRKCQFKSKSKFKGNNKCFNCNKLILESILRNILCGIIEWFSFICGCRHCWSNHVKISYTFVWIVLFSYS